MTMPVCPTCQQSSARLLEISKDAWVNYFSCDNCQHTWNVRKPSEPDGPRRIGRITYEGRFVIVQVPAEWKPFDPLPDPSASDVWFDRLGDFEAALGGPWQREPINRQPIGKEAPDRLPEKKLPRR
jgi:hypothetical protein